MVLPRCESFTGIGADSAKDAADGGKLTLTHTTAKFTLDTLARKQLEKRRRHEKDARLHNRCSAVLWLGQGRSPEEVAALLGVCPRTVRNWLHLYQRGGLEALRTLQYKGDPG